MVVAFTSSSPAVIVNQSGLHFRMLDIPSLELINQVPRTDIY